MTTTPPEPQDGPITSRPPVTIDLPANDEVDVVWRLLTEHVSADWLDEIGSLPVAEDDLETALDIWSVALTAALKEPRRREIASDVLARLQRLDDAT